MLRGNLSVALLLCTLRRCCADVADLPPPPILFHSTPHADSSNWIPKHLFQRRLCLAFRSCGLEFRPRFWLSLLTQFLNSNARIVSLAFTLPRPTEFCVKRNAGRVWQRMRSDLIRHVFHFVYIQLPTICYMRKKREKYYTRTGREYEEWKLKQFNSNKNWDKSTDIYRRFFLNNVFRGFHWKG